MRTDRCTETLPKTILAHNKVSGESNLRVVHKEQGQPAGMQNIFYVIFVEIWKLIFLDNSLCTLTMPLLS